jgi:eukaryotic-like serine/threonine-protein kinase
MSDFVGVSGDVLGPYLLSSELGRGGMGVVYRALDQRLGRSVAVKVVQPAVAAAAGVTMDELKQKLRREAQLAARVMHPNVVTVFAFEEIGENAVIAMELVEGATLHSVLANRERWSLTQAAHLLDQAADGVAAAHDLGIVHRDLKPGNLILTPDGRVKVLDFGIAKATSVDATAAVSRVAFGTVQYMAPEQILGKPVSPATDVWALGVILYETLAGVSAFGDGAAITIGMRVASEEPQFLREESLAQSVFGALTPVLRCALSKQPEARYPTAAVFRNAIRATGVGPVSGPLAVPVFGPIPSPALRLGSPRDGQLDPSASVEPSASSAGSSPSAQPVNSAPHVAVSAVRSPSHRPQIWALAIALATTLFVIVAVGLRQDTTTYGAGAPTSGTPAQPSSLPYSGVSEPDSSGPPPQAPPAQTATASPKRTEPPSRTRPPASPSPVPDSSLPQPPSAVLVDSMVRPLGKASIRIGSRTPGATLYINGGAKKTLSSLETIEIDAGDAVNITVKAERCSDWVRVIKLSPGQQETIGWANPTCTPTPDEP